MWHLTPMTVPFSSDATEARGQWPDIVKCQSQGPDNRKPPSTQTLALRENGFRIKENQDRPWGADARRREGNLSPTDYSKSCLKVIWLEGQGRLKKHGVLGEGRKWKATKNVSKHNSVPSSLNLINYLWWLKQVL